ncbi:hypothetical protein [Roseisolibacter agri]|nr:hypothetical protein [Roseisolibacter agri]
MSTIVRTLRRLGRNLPQTGEHLVPTPPTPPPTASRGYPASPDTLREHVVSARAATLAAVTCLEVVAIPKGSDRERAALWAAAAALMVSAGRSPDEAERLLKDIDYGTAPERRVRLLHLVGFYASRAARA